MNTLQRTLIEKAGHEYGFENVLPGPPHTVVLGSARHRAQVRITLANAHWQVRVPAGTLANELARRFSPVSADTALFDAIDIEQLAQLLLRTATLAQALPNQAAIDYETIVARTLATLPERGTEVERMVRQRIGQSAFRHAMLDYWDGACAVTGINIPEALRASHAKPWVDCSNDFERLDVFNGFLLSANLDALFDRGLISFDHQGKMLISSRINHGQRVLLGLDGTQSLRWLSSGHLPYLQFHQTLFIA